MMPPLLGRTLAIAGKEVRHILRDPQVLIFALAMPVLLILLFGYAVSFDIEQIPLVVMDDDRTAQSRALVDRFQAAGTFSVVARRERAEEAEPLFRAGLAKGALVIPHGFARQTLRGGARAQLLLDGSDNTSAAISLGYANAVALTASREALMARGGATSLPLELRVRTLFNPALRSAVFLVPGLMVLVLVMVAVMLTALAIAREYERGSLEQLFSTPVGRAEVILGKLGPYFAIGLLQVLLVLTVGVLLFDVPVRGSLLLLFCTAALFLLAMLMQGLLISVVTRAQMLASQVAALSTFLPALLLSGFIFPIENMPPLLRGIAAVLPARYFVHALRAILLRGNGLEVVAPDLAALAGFFLLLFTVAVRRFKRTLD